MPPPTGPHFPLRELLRHRRQLSPVDTLNLLSTLPLHLDRTPRGQTPLLDLELQFFADRPRAAGAHFFAESLYEWPPFMVDWPHEFAPSADSLDDATRLDHDEFSHEASSARLAALVYELLGGKRNSRNELIGSPLPNLTEKTNIILKRAMTGGEFATCVDFWNAWVAAVSSCPETCECRIPDALTSIAQHGELLRMREIPGGSSALMLSARANLHIGRSSRSCEFVARHFPDNADNRARTRQLSRVHVTGQRDGDGVSFLDGNQGAASANGSWWNEEPLASRVAQRIESNGILRLGPDYQVSVTFLVPATPSPRITNLAGWRGLSQAPSLGELAGGCRFPCSGLHLESHPDGTGAGTIWVWSHRAFPVDCSGERPLRWRTRVQTSSAPVAFSHLHGAFWLHGLAREHGLLAVDDMTLQHGEVAPLISKQRIRIGSKIFEVDVV